MRDHFFDFLRGSAIGTPIAVLSIGIFNEIFEQGLRTTLYDWQGLTAGLLGLAAGSIAWFAAQNQIRANAELEMRRERAASALFVNKMTEILEVFDVAWTKVDQIIGSQRDEDSRRLHISYYSLDWHLDRLRPMIAAAAELAKEMDLVSLQNAVVVNEYLNHFLNLYERDRKAFDETENKLPSKRNALVHRAFLSHLNEAVSRFDPRLSLVFADRTKANVNWQRPAEALAPMRDENWPH